MAFRLRIQEPLKQETWRQLFVSPFCATIISFGFRPNPVKNMKNLNEERIENHAGSGGLG